MFKKENVKDNKGFTIIEVLIVLAIAGLILLIVFLAVPALQRNQRNNARSSDVSKVLAAVNECLANRSGQTASCVGAEATGELKLVSNGGLDMSSLSQISSVSVLAAAPGTAGSTGEDEVVVAFASECDGNGKLQTGGNGRAYAAQYLKEGAQSVDVCVES